MDNNQTASGNGASAPTSVFEVNEPTGVAPVGQGSPKAINEKTLRKRLARFSASKPVLVLAILLSASAVLTLLRGYYLPFTLLLFVGRGLAAAAVWTVHLTAGKKGSRMLAALPLYVPIFSAVVLLFMAVFLFFAMFGKMVLIGGSGAVSLVRLAYSAKLWTVIPALACVVAAYCFYLFARHERLLLCNMRDGLLYGFAFENGYKGFLRSCIVVAVALPVIHIFRGVIGSFSEVEALSKGAAVLFDKLFMSQLNYWLNLVGILVHSAALVAAGNVGLRYSAIVKRYKAQKQSRRQAAKDETRA